MPHITGILLDFYAAKEIADRAIPAELQTINDIRLNQRLHCCFEEEPLFDDLPNAALIFGNQGAHYPPVDDQFYDLCEELSGQIPGHKFFGRSRCPVHIAALARSTGMGVVTDHVSQDFIQAWECCHLLGVSHWNSTTFFASLNTITYI